MNFFPMKIGEKDNFLTRIQEIRYSFSMKAFFLFFVLIKSVDSVIFNVNNVPPKKGCKVDIPHGWKWLEQNSEGRKNNFFQIELQPNGKYQALAGVEVVKTVLCINRQTGRINLATMENPVHAMMWECDLSGTNCNSGTPLTILRKTRLEALK